MIVIDGQHTSIKVNNFANLEELLVKVLEEDALENRVITDVFVNDEAFSEIYPHQAEDIETREISSVKICSLPIAEVAMSISDELYKVIHIMSEGSRRVAELFRQADDSEALETYQDLLEVVRDFLGMIGVLRSEFSLEENTAFNEAVEEISSLLGEMTEVMENEDWVLLADLLEYEFLPAVEKWKQVIHVIREDLKKVKE